jgi:prepilin-type N-terminal cleavage/methylation domain-containing protein
MKQRNRPRLYKSRAFTLVELMFVVSILGMLMSIAVLNFTRARDTTRIRACQKNRWMLDAAKEQWMMENRKSRYDTPSYTDLVGRDKYIFEDVVCPMGTKESYVIGDGLTFTTCTTPGHTD